MLTINGVVVPHAVHAAERDDENHDPIRDWCLENGVDLAPKGEPSPLPAPLAALRAKLDERAKAREAERTRVRERNAKLAQKNAPALPARAAAKVAPTQVAPTKPDSAKGKE